MNCTKRFVPFALIAAGLIAGSLPAQDGAAPKDPLLERTATRYSVAEWPQGARRAGFPLGEVEIAGLTGKAVEFHAGGVSRRFDDAKGVGRVLIELAVGEKVADAHAALLTHIAYVQSTKTLPTAAERSIRAGDVGYIGYGGKDGSKIAWLAFVVGNLEFRVQDLGPDAEGAVDVKPVVEQLSARALALPALAEGVALPRPAIAKFAAEATEVKAGDSLALDLAARDIDGKPAAVDFIVGGSNQGQGYVEQDEQARWRFHATGPGKLSLTLEARSRLGTTSQKTIEVTVR